MTFSQILDRIYRLLRAHSKPLVAIGLLPIGILFACEVVFGVVLFLAGAFAHPPAPPNALMMGWSVAIFLLLFVPCAVFVYGIYYGATCDATLRADQGLAVSVRESFRVAWKHAGRFVWLMFLRAFIVAAPLVLCLLAFFAAAMLLGLVPRGNANSAALFLLAPLGMLLYLGCIVYAVIMSLRLSLAFPACVHEGLTARAAIARSGKLTQGAKGRIFLALLVIYAIGYAVFLVIYVVIMIVVAIGAVAGIGHIQAASPLVVVAVGVVAVGGFGVVFLWTVLLMAAYSTAFAVFYRDQCLRVDGRFPAALETVDPD
jgi:hypothetical protein